jgi:hypothetical protein
MEANPALNNAQKKSRDDLNKKGIEAKEVRAALW